MKGTIIVCCFRDLLIEKHGRSSWEKVLETSGLPRDTVFLPTEDSPDEVVLEVLTNLCKALNISLARATESFGEYWINRFAPRLYHNFGILVTSSRDFVLKLNDIHTKIAKAMKGTVPPPLRYRWKDEDTLLITNDSKWGNTIFFAGLLKGVARYFDEELTITMWSSNQMAVKFPAEACAGASEEGLHRLEERNAYQKNA